MKFKSKAKEKSNLKLKKEFPLLSHIVDDYYNDFDFHLIENDEITGKRIIANAMQYEESLRLELQDLMVPINELRDEETEAHILNRLRDVPCGIYGD